MNYLRRVGISIALAVGVGFFGVGMASAERYTSPSYTIDASVGNSFGGNQSSTNYKLTSSGGESIIGSGAGGSYVLGAGYVAQLDKSLQVTVQPSGQVAYFPLDETSGTQVNDVAPDNNNGTRSSAMSSVSGKVGNALTFSGTNQEVTVPHVASLSLTGDMTVSAWIQPGAASQTALARILSKFNGTDLNYMLAYDNLGTKMRFMVDCDTRMELVSTTTLTNTSSWYHVTGTKSGTDMKLYINGSQEASGACTGAVKTNTTDLGIGGTPGSPFFNGKIDEVKIYSRALSAHEVKAEYDAGTAGNAAGLSFTGDIIPGVSQASLAEAIVQTDAPGYTLMLNQNQDLTSGGSTISSVTNGGTITGPATWTESTTKGLGFTLTGVSATALPGKWGTNPNYAYAALPNISTSFYTRTGYTGGGKDTVSIQYRVDVPTNQTAGSYTNTVTYTGVMTP